MSFTKVIVMFVFYDDKPDWQGKSVIGTALAGSWRAVSSSRRGPAPTTTRQFQPPRSGSSKRNFARRLTASREPGLRARPDKSDSTVDSRTLKRELVITNKFSRQSLDPLRCYLLPVLQPPRERVFEVRLVCGPEWPLRRSLGSRCRPLQVPRRRSRTGGQRYRNAARLGLPDGCHPFFAHTESENDSSRKPVVCGYFCSARATGLEPATTGSTVRYSNQLSYAPKFLPVPGFCSLSRLSSAVLDTRVECLVLRGQKWPAAVTAGREHCDTRCRSGHHVRTSSYRAAVCWQASQT